PADDDAPLTAREVVHHPHGQCSQAEAQPVVEGHQVGPEKLVGVNEQSDDAEHSRQCPDDESAQRQLAKREFIDMRGRAHGAPPPAASSRRRASASRTSLRRASWLYCNTRM